MKLDKRYNRAVTELSRMPLTNFGSEGIGTIPYEGYIKCKLAHGLGYSIVLPDVLLLGTAGDKWIQPLSFGPNVLTKVDDLIGCGLSADVSCGHRLVIRFTSRDLVSQIGRAHV